MQVLVSVHFLHQKMAKHYVNKEYLKVNQFEIRRKGTLYFALRIVTVMFVHLISIPCLSCGPDIDYATSRQSEKNL